MDFSFYIFENYPWLFVYHLHCPSVQPRVSFPLTGGSRVVGHSVPEFLNNICSCSHGKFKLLGDGLIESAFYILVYNFLFDFLKQLFPLLSLVHAQCVAHDETKLQSDYFSLFK